MDELTALRLQIEWGADEAILHVPQDRLASPPPASPGPADGLASARRPLAAVPRRAAEPQTPELETMPTLAALREALDSFAGCALRDTATSLVAPAGGRASGLAVIGEAPSADDDRSGRPFSGPLGAKLDRWLASIGLARDSVLTGHLVPWRPPGGRSPSEGEIAACLPFLLRYLALTGPRRVLLLGSAPAKALAGSTEGIRRLRGKWQSVRVPGLALPIAALPLLPPDQAITPAARRACWADLILLRGALDIGNHNV